MNMQTTVSVKDFGAAGDGARDDSPAIQAALDSGAQTVIIPKGDYRIVKTLKINSNTSVAADPEARVFLCGDTPKNRGDFLLSNANPDTGSENITVAGGVWDGNNTGRYNVKPADLFEPDGWSGATLNFVNVKNLRLEDFTVANSVAFHIRMARLDGFAIRNIGFKGAEQRPNQDGLHFGGEVRHGLVENIRALTAGQTNDDLIALNADDCVERVDNYDLPRGDIEDVVIRNVHAEDCHTLVRICSVSAAVRDVKLENITGGCRCMAINMDAARYCRTPLFKDEDFPSGVGRVERVTISGMRAHFTTPAHLKAMIVIEGNVRDFKIEDFYRDMTLDQSPETPTFLAANLGPTQIYFNQPKDMEDVIIKDKSDCFKLNGGGLDFKMN